MDETMSESTYNEVMRRIQYRYVVAEAPPVKEEDIRQIEQGLGHELPADYRHFLSKYGFSVGGTRVVGYGDLDNTQRDGLRIRVGVFYGVGASSQFDILRMIRFYHLLDMPGHLLPIADSNGNQICLSLASSDFGRVYLWIQPSLQTGDPETDIKPVAKDFDTFVRSLRREDT
jgi:hypothetical protein